VGNNGKAHFVAWLKIVSVFPSRLSLAQVENVGTRLSRLNF